MLNLSLSNLPSELTLTRANQLDLLEINHPKVKAKLALQGAQLLSWQPAGFDDVLWLSEVEPFEAGKAIRGGVPICYPWFGGVKQPAHGTARIRVWQLTKADVLSESVELELRLENEAKLAISLGQQCSLRFTHLASEPAQAALHSYFRVADIRQIAIENLPESCFDSVSQSHQAVTNPRRFASLVDEIYSENELPTQIIDPLAQRKICIEHQNASEIVVWNPWHKTMSGMSEIGYQTMVCVETARIHRLLKQGESVTAIFTLE